MATRSSVKQQNVARRQSQTRPLICPATLWTHERERSACFRAAFKHGSAAERLVVATRIGLACIASPAFRLHLAAAVRGTNVCRFDRFAFRGHSHLLKGSAPVQPTAAADVGIRCDEMIRDAAREDLRLREGCLVRERLFQVLSKGQRTARTDQRQGWPLRIRLTVADKPWPFRSQLISPLVVRYLYSCRVLSASGTRRTGSAARSPPVRPPARRARAQGRQ